jgi:hypothetical protein
LRIAVILDSISFQAFKYTPIASSFFKATSCHAISFSPHAMLVFEAFFILSRSASFATSTAHNSATAIQALSL